MGCLSLRLPRLISKLAGICGSLPTYPATRPRAAGSKIAPLEVNPAIDDEAARACRGCDTPKRVRAVDVRVGISKVRMIEKVDRVQPEFKFLSFVDLEALDQVHVEIDTPGPSESGVPECANLAWLRIHQNNLPVAADDCFVRITGVQAIHGRHGKAGIRDLCESVKVNDPV